MDLTEKQIFWQDKKDWSLFYWPLLPAWIRQSIADPHCYWLSPQIQSVVIITIIYQ